MNEEKDGSVMILPVDRYTELIKEEALMDCLARYLQSYERSEVVYVHEIVRILGISFKGKE